MKRILTLLMALALLAGAVQPALAEPRDKPACFIPEVAAGLFNRLLEPTFRVSGATDSQARADQYQLTQASIEGSVLYLSAATGMVELCSFFQGGSPDTKGYASTVTLAVSKAVPEGDLLTIGSVFAQAVASLDGEADRDAITEWMKGAVAEESSILPMNGYTLAFTTNDNGSMFALVANDLQEGGDQPVEEPEPEPEPEPTEAPAPSVPDEAEAPPPTRASDLPDSLEGADLEWNGIWVKAVRYKVNAFSDGRASVYVYFRVLNTADQKYMIWAEDTTVNGVTMEAKYVGAFDAHSDNGEDTTNMLQITALEGNEEKCNMTLAYAQGVKTTLYLLDEKYDRVYSQKIRLDFSHMEGERDRLPEVFRQQTQKPEATQKPSEPKRVDSSGSYRSLCRGDKGDDVKKLQQRLIDLGWLSDVADGEFGPKTASAVLLFNEANGLGSSSTASEETQRVLFSSYAKSFEEPWIPAEPTWIKWTDITGDMTSYKIQITNHSKNKTIKGVELRYYPTDVWGNRLWDYDYRYTTFTLTIKPGQKKFTQWFAMSPSWYAIDRIYVGVSKIVFTDGTIHENDDITYYYFVMH